VCLEETGAARLDLLRHTEGPACLLPVEGVATSPGGDPWSRLLDGARCATTQWFCRALWGSGDLEGALGLLPQMEKRGPAPDIAAYNCVAKGVCVYRGAGGGGRVAH